jgi:hypothetical protein
MLGTRRCSPYPRGSFHQPRDRCGGSCRQRGRESEAVPFELLEDETLAAEESRAESFREREVHINADGRGEIAVLLAEHRAVLAQIERDDFSRIGSSECDASLSLAAMREHREEE